MNMWLTFLAQDQTPTPTSQTNPMALMFPLLIAMVVFMLLSSRSQKKREKRERAEMYARMSKNDRVLTVGGVVGTVVSTKDEEVVLKVDESTNTKMTFARSAIQRILTDDAPLGSTSK